MIRVGGQGVGGEREGRGRRGKEGEGRRTEFSSLRFCRRAHERSRLGDDIRETLRIPNSQSAINTLSSPKKKQKKGKKRKVGEDLSFV